MKGIALFLALYMFVGSLFPRTDFGQLAKMGNIIEHYRQHQSDMQLGEEQLSFSTFLKVHFISPDEHRQVPGHEHEELPFHTINTSQNYTVHSHSDLYLPWLNPVVADHQFFYTHPINGDFATGIYHPPAIG